MILGPKPCEHATLAFTGGKVPSAYWTKSTAGCPCDTHKFAYCSFCDAPTNDGLDLDGSDICAECKEIADA